jgi:hypothetical protein
MVLDALSFAALAVSMGVACVAAPSTAALSNLAPRLDTSGAIVDCHSGNVVWFKGRFFLYGEAYGNSTGFGENMVPKLSVYSSPSMASGTWVSHGHLDALGNWSWATKVGTSDFP